MNWTIVNIVWDADFQANYPQEAFVPWESGCETREQAIDLVADMYDGIIMYCEAFEE